MGSIQAAPIKEIAEYSVVISGSILASGLLGFGAAKLSRFADRVLLAERCKMALDEKRQEMESQLATLRINHQMQRHRLQEQVEELRQLQLRRNAERERMRQQIQQRLNEAAAEIVEPLQRAQQRLIEVFRVLERRQIQQERQRFGKVAQMFLGHNLQQTDNLDSGEDEDEENEEGREAEETRKISFFERAPQGS